MVSPQLYMDAVPGEVRFAALVDDELQDFHVIRGAGQNTTGFLKGALAVGRVSKVVPSLQAAFVDIGLDLAGFLPVAATFGQDISQSVQEGQRVFVQIKKDPQSDKGALLSQKIDLEAADVILTVGRPGVSVSRKIKDEQRRLSLKETFDRFGLETAGFIIRTSAEQKDEATLAAQFESLSARWKAMEQLSEIGVVSAGKGAIEALFTKWRDKGASEVFVSGHPASVQDAVMASAGLSVQADSSVMSLLDEAQAGLTSSFVPLSNGGNLVIERTKALIAIDVNMAQHNEGRDREQAILNLNLAAAAKIAEQVNLRNLSGQIVVDCVGVRAKGARERIVQAFKTAFKSDKRATVHGMTALGLIEITRARAGWALDELYVAAPTVPEYCLRAVFYDLLRALAVSTGLGLCVRAGRRFASFWDGQNLSWIEERLGYKVPLVVDETLAQHEARLEKVT